MRHLPNMIIVRGTGRNVGKTLSACNIISNLAEKHETIGIKISPHFHELSGYQDYIHQSEDFVIVEEKFMTDKDSSRMLQAGAKKVFYIQAKNDQLLNAINLLNEQLNPASPVVVESGGLYDYIEPALLLNVVGEDSGKIINIRKNSKSVLLPSGKVSAFNWNVFKFLNGKFAIYA